VSHDCRRRRNHRKSGRCNRYMPGRHEFNSRQRGPCRQKKAGVRIDDGILNSICNTGTFVRIFPLGMISLVLGTAVAQDDWVHALQFLPAEGNQVTPRVQAPVAQVELLEPSQASLRTHI